MSPDCPDCLGLYVHYAFCERKCPYCDFVSIVGSEPAESERYFALLQSELDLWLEKHSELTGRELSSIYFGGGTPSLASAKTIGRFIGHVRNRFALVDPCEITLEANPHSSNSSAFQQFRAAGINRLSLGIQSLHPADLKALERIHTADQARQALTAARDAGFDNLSADLIFGIPGQTRQRFRDNLQALADMRINHLSVYGLTIYPGTEFDHRQQAGKLRLPSDGMQARMFLDARQILSAVGYEHYEISNYALPGYASCHNRLYWNDGEWLGLGISAHSSFAGQRWENPALLNEWAAAIASGDLPARRERPAEGRSAVGELIMLGLRQSCGVSLDQLEDRFGRPTRESVEAEFASLIEDDLVSAVGDRRMLTEKGLLVADAIMSRFF